MFIKDGDNLEEYYLAFGELNPVQALLGYKDMSTTSIYLNADVAGVPSMIEARDAERTDRGYLGLMKTPTDRKTRGKHVRLDVICDPWAACSEAGQEEQT